MKFGTRNKQHRKYISLEQYLKFGYVFRVWNFLKIPNIILNLTTKFKSYTIRFPILFAVYTQPQTNYL